MGGHPRARVALRRPRTGTYREPETAIARANLFTGLRSMIFLRGGILTANLPAVAVNMPLRTLAQRCKRLTPLLVAPAALLLNQGQAKAVLIYNIFESAGNVVVQTNGALDLTLAIPVGSNPCGINGLIVSSLAALCTGVDVAGTEWAITGPTSFNGTVSITPANCVSGIATVLYGNVSGLRLEDSYTSNSPIVSSATFNGQTLAGLGFTTTGLIGTWSLTGTTETIQVFIGPPSPSGAAVPGPLPLLGAGAAFGWSRRLRKRIAAPLSTPPQA